MPRRNKSVSSIIPFAAQHGHANSHGVTQLSNHSVCNAPPGGLHQFLAWHTKALRCQAIHIAHLRGGKSSHPSYPNRATMTVMSSACSGVPAHSSAALIKESTTARSAAPCTRIAARSEEHTSELQSPCNLVCRLLLEKKKK